MVWLGVSDVSPDARKNQPYQMRHLSAVRDWFGGVGIDAVDDDQIAFRKHGSVLPSVAGR
tara:strand:+ start:208 stop:387 length:180 start_codon:yes stop_codon:yes gene_type:complete